VLTAITVPHHIVARYRCLLPAVLKVKCRLGGDVRMLSVPSNTAFSRIKSKLQSKFNVAQLWYGNPFDHDFVDIGSPDRTMTRVLCPCWLQFAMDRLRRR
jgi:hypothetical protein